MQETRPPDVSPRIPRGEAAAVIVILLANLLGPLVVGERFPFTISPMFRQEPTCYCEFTVRGPDGSELPLAQFALQRVYDGNPVGLGVGIQPPPTLDEFGRVPVREELLEHLAALPASAWQDLPYVEVEVTAIGDLDGRRVGKIEDRSFRVRVDRPGGMQ